MSYGSDGQHARRHLYDVVVGHSWCFFKLPIADAVNIMSPSRFLRVRPVAHPLVRPARY